MNASVLIVQNSRVQAELLKRFLEEGKFKVLKANSGMEALEIATENDIDLIISDVNMPEMDGYELCAKIKGDPGLKDIPVAVVTALSCLFSSPWAEILITSASMPLPLPSQKCLKKPCGNHHPR